jgi:hypothetical protein
MADSRPLRRGFKHRVNAQHRGISTMKLFVLAAIAATGLALGSTSVLAAELTPKDYMEIEQLYAAYNHAIDSGDAETWANTFTPDGSFNRFAGHDALVGFIGTWREKMNGANRRHWNTNLRILATPEGASGSVYLMLVDVSTKPPSIIGTAMYADVLVKTKDGWRFKQRTTKPDAPPATPAAPAVEPAKP